jgi:hypothetical protein
LLPHWRADASGRFVNQHTLASLWIGQGATHHYFAQALPHIAA